MNRRTFLQLLGLAPAVGLVAPSVLDAPLASKRVEANTLLAAPESIYHAILWRNGTLYVGGQFADCGGHASKVVSYDGTWNQLAN